MFSIFKDAAQILKLVTAALVCTTSFAEAVSGTYAYFTDKDSGGGALYGGAPVWVATANACQTACTADPNCYGWTFSIPSVAGWNGPCYLKANENCDATSLSKTQASGKVASGIISNSCTVTCNGKPVTVVSNCAIVTPTPTSTKAAGKFRRDMAEREANELKSRLCPRGLTACPIHTNLEGYECVDLSEELESCGACGNDCTLLKGVKDVTCRDGVKSTRVGAAFS